MPAGLWYLKLQILKNFILHNHSSLQNQDGGAEKVVQGVNYLSRKREDQNTYAMLGWCGGSFLLSTSKLAS